MKDTAVTALLALLFGVVLRMGWDIMHIRAAVEQIAAPYEAEK